jgi:hypothetical protein
VVSAYNSLGGVANFWKGGSYGYQRQRRSSSTIGSSKGMDGIEGWT